MGELNNIIKKSKKSGKKIQKNSQIVNKNSVTDYGEVYTAESEVKAMVDLVKNEAGRIESTFLEPACGNGNFLAEILQRKLNVAFDRYRKSQTECEKYLVVAVGSIYGIDIIERNVIDCRKRLFNIFKKMYRQKCRSYASADFEKVILFILNKNIVWGDALIMNTVIRDPETNRPKDTGNPIVFSQWSAAVGTKIKRHDFQFKSLYEDGKKKSKVKEYEFNLESFETTIFNDETVKEHPLVPYMELCSYD